MLVYQRVVVVCLSDAAPIARASPFLENQDYSEMDVKAMGKFAGRYLQHIVQPIYCMHMEVSVNGGGTPKSTIYR